MAIKTLIDTLERMNELHETMLELSERKKQAIIDNEVEEMTRIINKESKFIKQIEELDAVRQQAVYAFLKEKGIKSNLNLTITELLRLVFHPAEKQSLSEVQHKLADTVHRLKQVNELNQELIRQSLSMVNFSLDLMVGGPEDEVTYQHPGQQHYAAARSGLFDSKI